MRTFSFTRAQRAVQKRKEKRLEQYNSKNKLIHPWTVHQHIQPTSHMRTHTHTHTTQQVKWGNLHKKGGGSTDLASSGRFWTDESSKHFWMQWLTECVWFHEADNTRQKKRHEKMCDVQILCHLLYVWCLPNSVIFFVWWWNYRSHDSNSESN